MLVVIFYQLLQLVAKRTCCKCFYYFLVGLFALAACPFVWIFHCFYHGSFKCFVGKRCRRTGFDIGIKSACKVGRYVFVGISEAVQNVFCNFVELVFNGISAVSQFFFIFSEVFGIAQQHFQFSFVRFVEVFEDVQTKGFYLADDVPTHIVLDAVVDVTANPLQHGLPLFKTFYHLVYCFSFYLFVVKVYSQVGSLS